MGEAKRKKRFNGFFKKATVAMMSIAMLLQPLPGLTQSTYRSVEAAVLTGDYIDLQQTTTELYVGSDWAGADASVSAVGAKATLTVNNFGTGGSNEWGIQYMVKDLGLKSSTKYQVDFDITSTVDKDVFIKLDDTGLIVELIHLTAGMTYHYSKESSAGTPSIDKQILYFALGRTGSEAENLNGKVDIENVKVQEVVPTGDYINLQMATTELYVGSDWAGANASVSAAGAKATLTVNNFGTGGSNEWGIQYMVKDLGLKGSTKYQVEFDITSTVDKDVFIKLDDTGLIAELIHLAAGVTYHYSKESSAGTPSIDKQILYFALGRTGSEAENLNGTVDIENVKVKEVALTEDYIDLQTAVTELYVGSDWAGADVLLSATGAKATFTVNNFGTDSSNEWGIQYLVKDLVLKSSTKYQVEFDITSTVDKDVYIKLDDSGKFINKFIHLIAGEKYHYSDVNGPGEPSASKPYFFFAFGRTGGEAGNLSGSVTIENLKIEEFDDSEIATDITINKAGTNIQFQLANNMVNAVANAYYAISATEAEANALSVGDAAFKECTMSKKVNGIWEVSDTVALTDGQIIRYYFNKDGSTTTPVNHTFSHFVAVDYTYDNQADLVAEDYDLVWDDEFNGTDLDPTKWSFQIGTKDPNGGPDYWGNNEQEYYTDQNYEIQEGNLVITAREESMGDRDYTSTRIRTKTDDNRTLFATRYGRIEARMKLPTQEGLWPAFWMLPVDTSTYGTWAASGELDIMEARGRVPDRVGGTAHFGSQWPNNTYYGKEKIFDSTTDISGYHLYSMEWEPGKITWLVDDVPYFTTGNYWSKGAGNAENYAYGAPFDVPFYLVLNLAVGGNFDGDANLANAEFPADMAVDYVRVYKKSDDYYQNIEDNLTAPVTGKDTTSFESPAYQPTGVDGDYVNDTVFNTLKTVAEVKPDNTEWQFFVGAFGGEAAMSIDTIDGTTYAKASIAKGGSQSYAVQLIKHFPYAYGYTYEISFDAKASADRNFVLKPCGDGDNGWAGYGVSKTISLTSTMTHYTHQFTMDKDSDPTARLEFDLGLATGDVWIGNVVVKMVEPVTEDNTDIFKNPDQSGGNHIYNGTFDQGTGRLAFWHTTDVAVEVPGVINPVFSLNTGDSGDYSHRAFVTANSNDARIYQRGIWLQQSDIYQLSLNLSSGHATKVTATLTNKDGSKVYMNQIIDVVGSDTRDNYTVNFAMPKGVTDTEAVFTLTFENGATVSVDNIRLVRTTNNNVAIDYNDVILEPITSDSTGWINNLNNGTVTPATNQDGEITSQTLTNSLTYMSMLYIPVSVKEGITYHLSFLAKSQYDNSVLVNVQEDNSWAVTLEQQLNMKAEEWQEFNYTINSTLTNGSNPIYLKFLLSGPTVTPGTFVVKNVSMTAEVQEGAKDAPADTVITNGTPIKGKEYVIELKDGDYKTKFLSLVEKPDRKALIMVNGSALPDGSVKDGKIIIPASVIGAGNYRIELALDGFNNIVLSGTVSIENGNSGGENNNNTPGGSGTPVIQPPAEVVKPAAPVVAAFGGENRATGLVVAEAEVDNNGKAIAEVDQSQVLSAIADAGKEAKRQKGKVMSVEIRVDAPATATIVETSIPREAVKLAVEHKIGVFTLSTPVAAISFDTKSLATLSNVTGTNLIVVVAKVEDTDLSTEARQLVGNRPVFRISVTSGDQTITQFAGSVTVTVPYTPGKGENTNSLVIYYINDKGEAVAIRNCAYHSKTGTISFVTNHFSDYAVGYNKIKFKDVASSASYRMAVDFVAARGIVTSIDKGKFNPKGKVTKGDFLVMLMKAYDIAPDTKPKNNFADTANTTYAGYLSAAKRLGLCGTVKDNKFYPDKEITRQEMAVLIYNALKAIDRLPQGNTGRELSSYTDVAQVASSAKQAVKLMTRTGIIGGSGKKLSPKAAVTREETARVLYNLLMK